MNEQPTGAEQPEQPAPNGVPQWIPATPPIHPYANGQPAAPMRGGKAISIAAMAIGLVALLTVLVSVAYFNAAFAVLGGVLGIVAVVLGVIALAKKARPLGAGITGLATGALTMVTITVLLGVGALSNAFTPVPLEQTPPGGESWQPGAEQESLLDWPANMQTGGVVFTGPGDPRPIESEPLTAGAAPAPNQVDRDSRTDILVYVDYRCPHCGIFEQQNGDYLAELMATGNTTVEIVPLSFMDRSSEGSYYSSRAAGAVACFAEAQPGAAWAAHQALLSAEVQPGAGPGPDNAQLLAALKQHVGAIDPAVSDCVTTEAFVPFAQALNEWVFQNPVPNTVDTNVRLEGTPTVVVNGVVYPGDAADPAEFKAFVKGLAL